jgi:hypothetical protein
MATPVRTLSSAFVSTGDPTRESHYDNLRADLLIALTEADYGATGSLPGSPTVGQLWMDTTLDVYYMSFDGAAFAAIASSVVTVDEGGITLASAADLVCGDGLVLPVGANKWVTA